MRERREERSGETEKETEYFAKSKKGDFFSDVSSIMLGVSSVLSTDQKKQIEKRETMQLSVLLEDLFKFEGGLSIYAFVSFFIVYIAIKLHCQIIVVVYYRFPIVRYPPYIFQLSTQSTNIQDHTSKSHLEDELGQHSTKHYRNGHECGCVQKHCVGKAALVSTLATIDKTNQTHL